RWAEKAPQPLTGCTVSWVASGSPHAWEIAREWIDSKNERIASAGWGTLSSFVAITDDAKLDVPELKKLLQRVQQTIYAAPDRVRYQMNGFVIAAGSYVKALTEFAKEVGAKIGNVTVDMGETACQVPFAPDYIAKVEKRGTIGKKRASAKC